MKKRFIATSFFFLSLMIVTPALAGSTNKTCPQDAICLDDPLKLPTDGTAIPTLIANVIKGALGIIGSLALVMIIYAGFTWMLSGGNSEKWESARKNIVSVAIGLIVVFSAYAILNFVFKALGGNN